MTEAPNNGGSGGASPPTASQLGAGVGNADAPATGADSAAAQGASPADADAEARRIAAKEKREGKKAGEAGVLERLGFESVEAAEEWVGSYRTIEQEMETAEQRERQAKETAEAERDNFKTLYFGTEKRYAVRDALRDVGVPGDRLNDALALAKLDELELDPKTGQVSGVEEVVKDLLDPRPWLLETNEQAQRTSAPAVTTTTARRRQDTSGEGSGDPKQDMGPAALDWLIAPNDAQSTWPP